MVSWLGGPRFTPLSNTWLYAGCYYLFANECCVFNYVLHGVLTFLELRVALIWGWIGVRLGKYGNCLRRNQTQNMTLPDLRESDILWRAPCNNLGRSCPPPPYIDTGSFILDHCTLLYTVYLFCMVGNGWMSTSQRTIIVVKIWTEGDKWGMVEKGWGGMGGRRGRDGSRAILNS